MDKLYAGKKIYKGRRSTDEKQNVVVVIDDKGTRTVAPRYDLANHSPDGYEWGYEGSGPAQLALALCADVLDDDVRALRVYQRVKRRIIAPLAADLWTLTEQEVRDAIEFAEHASRAHA
jgi:hypothetical protein